MDEVMMRASDELADARLEYGIAESNLAVARGELRRAERRFHEVWGKALANPAKVEPLPRPVRATTETVEGKD